MRLGEMLIERDQIEQGDLDRALELQKERGDKLGKILVDLGFIAMRDILAALSEQLGVPLAALDEPPPVAPEVQDLSSRFMRQCRFLPVAVDDSSVTIAMAAASPKTQVFMLTGISMLIPLMLGYNAYQYVVFRGKVRVGHGYEDDTVTE